MELRQILALFIPITALAIPIVAIVSSHRLKMAKLQADSSGGHLPAELEARLIALEDEVQTVRQQLGEAQERLDFTERLLASRSEPKPGQLSG